MIKPMQDWVITQNVEDPEAVKSNIILLAPEKKLYKFVEVLAIGPEGNPFDDFKVGDIVMVHSQTGLEIEHDGKKYEMAKAKNFFGVYCKEE
jgi:co-chaperonin GroES (HSP10)